MTDFSYFKVSKFKVNESIDGHATSFFQDLWGMCAFVNDLYIACLFY